MKFSPAALGGIVLLLCCGLADRTAAENWPGWRGPRQDGVSAEKNLPLKWSATENIAWKVALPCEGHASPVVWEDFLFIVGADIEKQDRLLLALDRRTGRTLWQKTVLSAPLERKHKLNSWASSTPATDGKLIYVSFLNESNMMVAAYDFEGNQVWKVEPGVFSSRHGYCSSPVLHKDKVIINGDHDGAAYLVALDRQTGKTLWKVDRENRTRSYCTPIIREIDGRTQMLLSGSKCIASYDPDDGSRHWIIDGPTEQFVASLVYNRGLLFVTGGFPDKHLMAIDPRGSGNITDSDYIKWHHLRNGVSYVPSPVAADRFFFIVSDNGIATCYDSESGKQQWQERMGRRFSASLLAADGHIYFQDDDGNTKVVKAAAEFELVATNKLGEATYSSPAISQGQIFIRGEQHLFCIGGDQARAAR